MASRALAVSYEQQPDFSLERNALVERYQRFVQNVVSRLVNAMGLPSDQYDDFVAAGYLGLVEAAERFDFSCGSNFKSFAYLRIRGAVIDCIRSNSQLSGRAYRYAKALHASQDLRECEHEIMSKDRSLSKEERRKRLGKIMEYAAKSSLAYRLSFSDFETEATEMAADTENPEEKLLRKAESIQFRKIIAQLPEKERFIITECYFKGKSFAQLAQESSGMSKSWISRLHSRALDLLKQALESAPS